MPVPMLQQVITSSHFTELKAFKKLNTLSPDVWWSNAWCTAYQTNVDPAILVPGQVDYEELEKRKMQQAERSMDRRAQEK